MIAKCKLRADDFKFVLSFDLSEMLTGWSLIDREVDKVEMVGMIDLHNNKSELIWTDFAQGVEDAFNAVELTCERLGVDKSKVLVTKEKLPIQMGMKSTITTLQTLSKCHGIFDLITYKRGFTVYDYDGIPAPSVRCYFKKITGVEKPDKVDVAKYIYDRYKEFDFEDTTYDVTDSIAVTITLLERNYDKDISEEIKNIKKEQKKYKTQKKKDQLQDEIVRLEGLKYNAL